jgi:hypothetical protein
LCEINMDDGAGRGLRFVAALFAACMVSACGGGGGGAGAPGFGSGTPPPAGAGKYALRFIGTGLNDIDRVKIPLSATTPANVGASDFTIEFWIKGLAADNTAAGCNTGNNGWINGNIVIDRDVFGAGDFGDFGISLFSGRVAFGVSRGNGGATLCGNINVLDGNWHHVAVTRQRATGRMQIFVDGALDRELVNDVNTSLDVSYRVGRTTSYPNSDPFLVFGAEKHDAGAAFPSFRGLLDEVRISNNLRYLGTTIRPIAPFVPDGNTMALYHFDEGSGTTIGDSAAGAASPGVLRVGGANNGPQWVTDTPF